MALALWAGHAHAQVIEFESNGLKYQTLTRSGVTVMFAIMPQHHAAQTQHSKKDEQDADGSFRCQEFPGALRGLHFFGGVVSPDGWLLAMLFRKASVSVCR